MEHEIVTLYSIRQTYPANMYLTQGQRHTHWSVQVYKRVRIDCARVQARSQNCEKRLLASSCRSVSPSVCMELGSHLTDFHDIWCLIIFRKSVKRIQICIKCDKINGALHEYLYTFMIVSRPVLLRMRNVVEKIKTHILCSATLFRQSCRLSENVEIYSTAGQTTDDNMVHAYCILDT